MFRILWQQVIWSTDNPGETGVWYSVYKVGDGLCAHWTIYVTLAQGEWQSAKNTSSNDARYKMHINRAWVSWVTDDYGRPQFIVNPAPPPTLIPNPLFDPTSVTYIGWDEQGTLTYYPKRDNESLPDVYDNIYLDAGDEVVFYNFAWRVVVQMMGIELPNDMDTKTRDLLISANKFLWDRNATQITANLNTVLQQMVTQNTVQKFTDACVSAKQFFDIWKTFTQPL